MLISSSSTINNFWGRAFMAASVPSPASLAASKSAIIRAMASTKSAPGTPPLHTFLDNVFSRPGRFSQGIEPENRGDPGERMRLPVQALQGLWHVTAAHPRFQHLSVRFDAFQTFRDAIRKTDAQGINFLRKRIGLNHKNTPSWFAIAICCGRISHPAASKTRAMCGVEPRTISTWDSLKKNILPVLAQKVLETFFDADPPMFLSVPFGMRDQGAIATLFEGAGFQDPFVTAVRLRLRTPHGAAPGHRRGHRQPRHPRDQRTRQRPGGKNHRRGCGGHGRRTSATTP